MLWRTLPLCHCAAAWWSVSNVTPPTPLMYRLVGLPRRPCTATREQPTARDVEVTESAGRVARQGHGFNPRGSTNRCLGFWTRSFVPKVASDWGMRCRELPGHLILLGLLHASPSWAHSRFASGCGPTRAGGLVLVGVECKHMRMRVQYLSRYGFTAVACV